MNLFLDIEETIIESLDNPLFLKDNIVKIKTIIQEVNPSFIGFFSFALFDENDFNTNEVLLRNICKELNLDFSI